MLESLVAIAAGLCIFYRGVNVLHCMDAKSNHLFRFCWAVAVGGALGLIFAPFQDYRPGWIELIVVSAFAAMCVSDQRRSFNFMKERGDGEVS